MNSTWLITVSLLTFVVIGVFFPRIYHHLLARRMSTQQSSGRPPRLAAKDVVFGIDTVLNNLRWMKEHRRMDAITNQILTYGHTFESWPFGRRVITTIDSRNIQFVLSIENEKFGVAPVRELAQTPMTGTGIITSDGDSWMHGRNLIKPTFVRTQIADRGMIARHFQRFVDLLPHEGESIDLQPLLDRLILDASSEFIFGQSFDTLLPSCPIDARHFLDSFNYAQKGVGARVMMGKMSFMLRDQRFWDSCDTIRKYTQQHVDASLVRSRTGQLEEEEIERILIHAMSRETTDRNILCSQLLNVFFAGRDTPAVALANILFCLARHPQLWTKLRDQVKCLTLDELTFERLKSLRYLQYIINEGMRLYPPVPNQSRGCLFPTFLPYGGGSDGSLPIFVVPGDTISMNFFNLHRNPKIYPEPNIFNPDRWATLRPGWNFMPFGGGARHCPAQQLALYWVGYTIVRLAMTFKELRNRDPVLEYVENWKLNMESLNGVKVELVKA